jgi:hypothetical protein
MLVKKVILPAACLLVLGAVGCSSSAHRTETNSDYYGYRVEGSGAYDNSMTRTDNIENYNTTVSDNALRNSTRESTRYEEPMFSHNTTVFDNALNRSDRYDSVDRSEASYRSDVRDRDALVTEDSRINSDASVSGSTSGDIAGTTTTTTTTVTGDSAPGSYTSMYNNSGSTATGAAAGATTGMSSSERAAGSSVSNAAANTENAYNFVEISFEPGSTGLTESAKSSIQQVVSQAKNAGKLDEAIVMSWSDEEYPAKDVKKLPKAQRDLADQRNKAVKDYVKSIQRMDVDTYNMASQPNVLSKWFNTTDAKLKNSLTAAGLPTTGDSQQYPSKASHSLVLIKVE